LFGSAFAADRVLINPDSNGNYKIMVSPAGVPTDAITVSGTTGVTTLGQPLPVASGGTGAATQSAARTNLGITLPVPLADGGTGAVTQSAARTNLGLGGLATLGSVGSSEITDGSVTNADVSGSAAIATSKVSGAVTSIAGNGLGGLATLSAVNSSLITDDTIANADISSSAAISGSKIVAASGSVSGVVTTSAQTLTGAKTFDSAFSLSSSGGNVPNACVIRSNTCTGCNFFDRTCNAGEIVVGGGCDCSVGPCGGAVLTGSHPSTVARWQCNYSTNTAIVVYAICCRY